MKKYTKLCKRHGEKRKSKFKLVARENCPACIHIYETMKKYRAKNKAKIAVSYSDWYIKNKEAVQKRARKQSKEYYYKNRDKISAIRKIKRLNSLKPLER